MMLRTYSHRDEASVIELWRLCDLLRPWNNPQLDIARKLKANPDWFVVAEDQGVIVGTVMIGYEGHRGAINYLAVHPDRQRLGIGRLLMKHAEAVLLDLGCPKINLMVRETNEVTLAFYEAIGFRKDACIPLGKRLIPDD